MQKQVNFDHDYDAYNNEEHNVVNKQFRIVSDWLQSVGINVNKVCQQQENVWQI